MSLSDGAPRVGVLIVAYNATSTLAAVLDRIPRDLPGLTHVLVSDDHSHDDTYDVGIAYSLAESGFPITVVRQSRNLGYGGNQKFGYRWAIDENFDAVVLLHGDGQYAPELLPDMLAPLINGDADVVLGSRMMSPGLARSGGMPLYKYVGNRILSRYQNAVAGMALSEWHSGYRAFTVAALGGIPFEANSNGFDFDTEVLLQLSASGARITEIPIPTYYGDEICYVDGVKYARDVVVDVTRMRLAQMGFGRPAPGTVSTQYEFKPSTDSSHSVVLDRLAERPVGLVLDLGCGPGHVAERARAAGHTVVGVDIAEVDDVASRVDHFVCADLEAGLPASAAKFGPFDTVLAADVLEHVRRPGRLLDDIADAMKPGGCIIASIPNFGHWYVRARVLTGTFDYDRRGILDVDHVRFFTKRSFVRLAAQHGWKVDRIDRTGLPFDVADRGGKGGLGRGLRRAIGFIDGVTVRVWPSLFAYQFVAVLSRQESDQVAYTMTRFPGAAANPLPEQDRDWE